MQPPEQSVMSKVPGSDTILSLFHVSWGEVDVILPVLHKLKILKPDWRIVAVFSPEWRKLHHKMMVTNHALEAELGELTDDIIYFDQSKILIPGVERPEQVRIILKDFSPTVPFKSEIEKAFPHAKIVMHSHGIPIAIKQKRNQQRNVGGWEGKTYIKHDLIVVSSQREATLYYGRFSDAKYCIAGIPSHDQWRVKKLLESPELRESAEAKFATSASRVFVFFCNRSSNPSAIPPEVLDYIFRSVAEVVLSDKRNILLIKPHPRQPVPQVVSYFKGFDSSRYMITSLHAMQLASLADLVISFPSSAILDTLRIGKPVIEFFPIKTLHDRYPINKHGRLFTNFQLLGMTVPADTKEGLAECIDNFFNDTDRSVWERQKEAYRQFCPPGNASLRAARVILSLVEPDIAKQHDLPPIHSVWTPITNETRIFLKQEKPYALHLQLKRIKAYGMPISAVLLRELHQVSGAEIFVATGTFSEDIASQAAEIFKEVHAVELAADLYQPSAMPDIARHKNIHIYHSANVLRAILPSLKGRILFWLSTNETAGMTFKNRTNTPVIEELRAIGESGIKDSLILIDNMRYFQPIVSDKPPWYGRESRKYPDVQQAIDAILEIDRTYQFSILGDIAIAYPAGSPVTVSPTVRACTLSRMFNGNNADIISVLEAENMIAFGLPKSEKEAVQALHKDYYDPYEEPGVGGHYRFWYALTLFGEKRYAEAKNEFLKAIKLNCNHWRVVWFLAESAHRSGDTGLAKQAVKNSSLEKPAVAGYHRFWHGLTLFGEQRHAEAKQEFIRAMQLNCNHWRAAWFLAESAHNSGDIAMAKEAAQALLKAVPNFQPAKKLLERIESN